MSRAGATVAQGCGDGSSIYFSPANVAGTEGLTASLGATLIDTQGEFAYDFAPRPPYRGAEVDLQNDPIPVPHGYVTYGLSERLGLGLYVPYGLETNWPTRLADGSFFDGAFEGFRNRVQAIYVQPTAAYQVTPRLRVGGGPVVTISAVELNQLQDLSQLQVPGEEGYRNTHAVRLGGEYDVLDELTARAGDLYNTAAAPDETVTPLLPESDRNQFTVGVGWRPVDGAELNVSYQLLLQNDRRGRVRGPLPGEELTTALNQGLYSFNANLFGATLTLHL